MEKWKNSVDKDKSFGTWLTAVLKAIYCLNQDLLTAKLIIYWVSPAALTLIYEYLSNKKQWTKIDDS